jgi:hypothetical protein
LWRRNWARIIPFFNYPPDIRKAIYTTNSVESLNRSLRKIIKTRGGFPNEEAALKLLFLAARGQEVDHAHPSLARSAEPLHDSLAGPDAGLGESCTMKVRHTSAGMGGAKGSAPCPAPPSPNTNPGRLHKGMDTPQSPGEAELDHPHERRGKK